MKRIRNPFKGRASALGQRLTGRIRNRLVTDTLREVHHTFPRFLSLLVLSALAVCFLAGLRATAPDMKLSADAYFDQQNLMDLHIASTLGLTQEDVDAIAEEEGVASVQGAYTIDALVPMDNQEMVVKVLSYSGEGDVNQPALVEGRLPEGEDECLVEPLFLELSGLSIGDTISLDTGEGDYADALSVEEVTIVGTANSPLYIALDRGSSTLGTGSVDAFLILPVESFTMDYYTDAYLLAEGASELETYSDEYEELVDQLAQQLEPLSKERSALRYDEASQAISDAEDELAQAEEEANQQLTDAEAEITSSRQELDDAKKQMEDAKKQLDSGEAQYAAGMEQLESGWQALDAASLELEDGKEQYEQGQTAYQAALALYQIQAAAVERQLETQAELEASTQARTQATQAALQAATEAALEDPLSYMEVYNRVYEETYQSVYDTAYAQAYAQAQENSSQWQELQTSKAQLDQTKAQLDAAKAQLNQGEIEYRAGVRQLESSQRQLEASREELDQGWEDYETGLQQWEDGEKAYQEGYESYTQSRQEAEDQLKDGRKEVEQAKRDLTLLEDGEWYILDRNTNTGYVSYSMDADRIANLAAVFPLIFFLVAALVSLTTMTRMVEEQRTTIGGLKAMGFSRGSIAIKYVGYGFLSSVIGAVLGLAVGLTLLPWIICTAWSAMYTIGDIHYSFEAATSLLAAGAAVGTVTLAALLACFSTLAATPAQLMRPKAPPVGKRIFLERITPLWRKLSFHYKITLRNLFRYQKRFWMTVAGIGGCAALIVTAFGVRGSIMGVMEEQFDVLYHYSAQVGLVDEITPLELEEVEDTLSESGLVDDSLACRVETVTAQSESYTLDCYLQTTPSQEELSRFVELRHRTDDVPVTLPDDGAVITEKMASLLGVEVGDTITLDGESRVTITVADITEHYVQHYIYVSDTYYETLFGEAPTANTVLVDFPVEESGAGELESQLVSLDGVSSLTLLSDTADTFSSSMESVDYAVILIIFCAAALAFVVLMNLTNINITERLRELATLKVLGFYNREVSAYIYRENAILTVFGVLAGMVLGKFLHQWLILTVEVDMVMFDRVLDLSSYLWAAVLTVVFSLAVNLTARRKLRDLDMVEALKSVE
ncbi:FtsX-like permease family protein [Evtepia sp.]|uniref:FtsX-like permease family protein n=1 Tax=Evtepia sp. TaxID=2773933 RepID=UPI002E78D6BB|nr:FtsX-like permease family protein [Evtepia sp.]MEE0748930.1 FtsX-like permease family protein [Evtepia sp.]